MSRYIDADELRHLVLYFSDASNLNGNHEQTKAYNHCLCMIDDRKTANVRENVHSEWVKYDEGDCACLHCGFVLEDWTQAMFYKYCPSCGSDMRKEVEP